MHAHMLSHTCMHTHKNTYAKTLSFYYWYTNLEKIQEVIVNNGAPKHKKFVFMSGRFTDNP
jgi:hypothetical protein